MKLEELKTWRDWGFSYRQIAKFVGLSSSRVRELLSTRGRVNQKLNRNRYVSKLRGYVGCTATIDELLSTYQDECQICGKQQEYSLCLDHCHKTGRFRGWLCKKCNTAIGMLDENVSSIENIITYLKPPLDEERSE